MAVYFSGVNTGNKYEVGQTYSMGGDSYVAQADGSFTNQQTGKNFAGSSRPSEGQSVNWSSDGDRYSSGVPMHRDDYAPVLEARERASAYQRAVSAEQSQLGPNAVRRAGHSAVPSSAMARGFDRAVSSSYSGLSAGSPSSAGFLGSAASGLGRLWTGLTQNRNPGPHVIQAAPDVDGYDQLHGAQKQRAAPLVGDLIWFYPNEYYVDVGEFWEDFAGEPGEFVGGLVNIAAGILNSVPRNAERHAQGFGNYLASWAQNEFLPARLNDDKLLNSIGRSMGLEPLSDGDVLDLNPMRIKPMSAY